MNDTIYRQEAIEVVSNLQLELMQDEWDEITDAIKNIPSAEPKKGEWLEHFYPHFEVSGIECSICGKDIPYWGRQYEEPNYCPNCGANMKEEENQKHRRLVL